MAVDLKALGLDKLTSDEMRQLADALLEEADAKAPAASWLTDAQREELRRRITDAEANPDDYVTWEEVRESSLRRLGLWIEPDAVIIDTGSPKAAKQ